MRLKGRQPPSEDSSRKARHPPHPPPFSASGRDEREGCAPLTPPQSRMSARAVLTCRPESHPFEERTVWLDKPVSIGRSVARIHASPDNAIFDCKVLSRQHALLWFDNGRFYVRDTRSSNGTYVNCTRLSSGGFESAPYEVHSGDIVQFGIKVVENNRNETHGCIVATLKLYLGDVEVKAQREQATGNYNEFIQVYQYIQDALQREQLLDSKMGNVRALVEKARQSTDACWRAFISEDLLLSRIGMLESQLSATSKNFTDDKARQELIQLQTDKIVYQNVAKESLNKVHQERLDLVAEIANLQQSAFVALQEAELCREKQLQAENNLEDLAQKFLEAKETEKELRELLEIAKEAKEIKNNLKEEEANEKESWNSNIKDYAKESEKRESSEINAEPYTVLEETEMLLKKLQLKIDQLDASTDDNKDQNLVKIKERLAQISTKLSPAGDCADILNHHQDNANSNSLDAGDLAEEKERLASSLEASLEHLRDKESSIAVLKAEIADLKDSAAKLRREGELLQQQLAGERQEAGQLRSEHDAALASTRSQLSEREEELGRLRASLSGLKKELEAQPEAGEFEKLGRELEDVRAEAEAATRRNLDLERRLAEAQDGAEEAAAQRCAELEEELVLVKERCEHLAGDNRQLCRTVESVQKEYDLLVNKSRTTVFFYAIPVFMMLYFVMSFLFAPSAS